MPSDFYDLQKQVEISPFLDSRNGLLANPGRFLVVLIFAGELRSSTWKELSGLSNSSFHSARRHLIQKGLIVEASASASDSRGKSYRLADDLIQQLHSVVPGYLKAIKQW